VRLRLLFPAKTDAWTVKKARVSAKTCNASFWPHFVESSRTREPTG